MRFYLSRSKALLARSVIWLVLVAGGLALLNVWLEFNLPVWFVVALIFLIALAWFHAFTIDLPRRYYRGEPKFRDEYNLTFADAGIKFKTKSIDSSLAWSLYTGVVENENFHILIYGKKSLSGRCYAGMWTRQ